MIRRSWKTFLAGVAMAGGLSVSGSAFAGEGCCTPSSCMDCQSCQQLFEENNQKLTDQLAAMSCCCESSCCAPTSVCECAEDVCGEGCGEGCCGDSCGGITFGGWIQMGYHDGLTPNASGVNDAGSFNNHPHRFNLHQGWLYAEKVADGSCGMDWGFRADVMYGVDAADTQAFGNPTGSWDFANGFDHGQYGWAIPQLYAEVASGDLSVKLGHFYTLIGYEVVTAPDNFFYSHALTMFNSEPFTHTGALATYSVDDNTSIYAGWTSGWDTGFDQRFNGSSFLGGFGTALGDNVSFTYITTAGNFGARTGGLSGYSHSLLFDVTVTDKLNYILQSDMVETNAQLNDDLGVNQYLIYTVDEKVAVGTRIEWWSRDSAEQWAATFGVNVKPMDNLVIRPEIRHDWGLGPGNPAALNGSETTFGVDAILTF